TTLRMPDEEEPLVDGEEIFARVGKLVDAVIDIGVCGQEVSTVLDLTGPSVHIIRQGLGVL
ncbi:MAG: threonylcarbamoyl-AMP synthase, partial [Gammaproteobacteria bacterium]|nr:threonylcarbamoyl-AMP synthase [Gammaproteobacteria bacterium]